MNELVVISGKGGTGKTSIVATFAALAANKVLADCDVDAADLHLILQPRIQHSKSFIAGHKAVIRPADCTGCGECLTRCRFNAVQRQNNDADTIGPFTIDPVACQGCGVCVHFCAARAIDFPDDNCGDWFISETRHGPMVHAKLGIAADNSGKLVYLVRTEARKIAEQDNLDLIIVDGPPGIACPVIASITGASLLLIVTEPTLSGIHDLQRVAQLARSLDVAVLVCVNKADINPEMTDKIEHICHQNKLALAGSIPYDQTVTAAQLAGVSIIEHAPSSPAAQATHRLWQKIETTLSDLPVN